MLSVPTFNKKKLKSILMYDNFKVASFLRYTVQLVLGVKANTLTTCLHPRPRNDNSKSIATV